MDPFTILAIAGAALVAVSVVRITWKVVRKWITKTFNQKTWLFWKKNRAVHLVKKIENGKCSVIAGVLNRNLEVTDSQKWEGAEMDGKLAKMFNGRNTLYMQQW